MKKCLLKVNVIAEIDKSFSTLDYFKNQNNIQFVEDKENNLTSISSEKKVTYFKDAANRYFMESTTWDNKVQTLYEFDAKEFKTAKRCRWGM